MNTSVLRSVCYRAPAASRVLTLGLKHNKAIICQFSSQTGKTATEESGPKSARFSIPSWLQTKLGVGKTLSISATFHGQRLVGSDLPERASIFEQFQRSCADSVHVGVACYVDAISRNKQSLPIDSQVALRFKRKAGRSTWSFFGHQVDSQANSPDKITIRVKSRVIRDVQCSIANTDLGRQTISLCRLKITASPNLESLTSASPGQLQARIGNEQEYLSDIFEMVVKRFCTEMTFHSREEVTSTLAEATLRVLQFRTPALQIDFMSVYVEFEKYGDDPAVRYRSTARWKSAGQDASSDQPESKEVEVVIERPSREDTESEQNEGLGIDDESTEDLEPGVATEDEAPQRTDESTAESESVFSLVKAIPTHPGKLELLVKNFPCTDLQTRVGACFKSVLFVWDRDHATALKGLSYASLVTLLQNAGSSSIGHGLALARRVVDNIAKATPGNPQITMVFQSDGLNALSETSCEVPGRRKYVILAARANENITGETTQIALSFSGSPWHKSQIGGLSATVEYLGLAYKFIVPRLHDSGCEGLDSVAVVRRIRDFIESHLAPNVQLTPGEASKDLLDRCGRAILQLRQPLADLIYFSKVRIRLSAYDVRGHVVERINKEFSTADQSSREKAGEHVGNTQNGIFIALGSNLGDRFAAIESACRSIDGDPDMQIVKTSELFETTPMYVEDQGRFLNGVCEINTSLEPMELLDRLQAIENDLGRVKIIDKGPRNIDLDIVAYGERQLNTDRLIIPHRLMLEREFVLRPLSSIAPRFEHPATGKTIQKHFNQLPSHDTPMYPITPLAPGVEPLRTLEAGQKTLIMSILNVTPDSFSDGGDNSPADKEALKATAASHIAAGAAIIDIGGQSSRPNAPDISAEEEIARIVPAIEAIKSLPEAANIAISVDTYRAPVAEAAVNAGAHIINDISAGLLDPEMLPTIARLGCTYIMMHMRGTPHTMQNEENTSYPAGVVKTIKSELVQRLDAAQAAGIRRWRIILDPGVGFAKTVEQNVEILRDMNSIRGGSGLKYLPWLVGTSRKGFIGKITGVEKASDRVAGTAASVTAAVAGGASIVRVHDVEEMARVVKMADAIYRR